MKKIKIFVGAGKAPSGWVHTKTFDEFQLLLVNTPIEKISCISFDTDLDDTEDETIIPYTGVDCALLLIQEAAGQPLPMCLVRGHNIELNRVLKQYTHISGYEEVIGTHETY